MGDETAMTTERRLLTNPAEIEAAIGSNTSMEWRNIDGVLVGPWVPTLPKRHRFTPIAVATEKQLRQGVDRW